MTAKMNYQTLSSLKQNKFILHICKLEVDTILLVKDEGVGRIAFLLESLAIYFLIFSASRDCLHSLADGTFCPQSLQCLMSLPHISSL
jgi:hypothetical protein